MTKSDSCSFQTDPIGFHERDSANQKFSLSRVGCNLTEIACILSPLTWNIDLLHICTLPAPPLRSIQYIPSLEVDQCVSLATSIWLTQQSGQTFMRTLCQGTASGWGYGRGSCRPRLCFRRSVPTLWSRLTHFSLLHAMYFLRLWADKIQENDATPSHCLLGVAFASLPFQTYKCLCQCCPGMVLFKGSTPVLGPFFESAFD